MKRGMGVLLLGALLAAPSAWSLGPVTFGAEFTFFNPKDMTTNNGWEKVLLIMEQHLIVAQQFDERFSFDRKSKTFRSPNGWWFSVGPDPAVMEVQSMPATVEVWKRYKDDIQDAIFASAANGGFVPAMFQGGGHINLGTNVFEGNDLLLRNFVVDLINHNELFMGVFNYDLRNARPFQLLTPYQQKMVYEVIARFDKGEYGNATGQMRFLKSVHAAMDSKKRVAICLDDVGMHPQSRIEFRGVRPQASVDVWIRQIDLFYHRLQYLEKITEPIPIRWKVPLFAFDETESARHDLNPPLDPQAALQAFYEYVTESGLKWQDHTDYLWPRWITDGEVAKFEDTQWFHEHEARNGCEAALST